MMAGSGYSESLGIVSPVPGGEDVHALPFNPQVLGRPGFLHGGAIAGFLSVACDATAAEQGGGYAAITSTMDFLRGGREQTTYGRASVRARTARLLIVEATAWQESSDKPIAVMSRTYLRRGT